MKEVALISKVLKLEIRAVTVNIVVVVWKMAQSSQMEAAMQLQQMRLRLILSVAQVAPNVANLQYANNR